MERPPIRGTPRWARHARPSRLVAWIPIAFAGLILAASGPAGAQASSSILVVTVDGVITPVIADHLREALDRAETEGHQALLVEIDTPGGLDTSMRDIIQSFLNARVPVIVHVAPQGARAASAGALITLSSHVAAMGPARRSGRRPRSVGRAERISNGRSSRTRPPTPSRSPRSADGTWTSRSTRSA